MNQTILYDLTDFTYDIRIREKIGVDPFQIGYLGVPV